MTFELNPEGGSRFYRFQDRIAGALAALSPSQRARIRALRLEQTDGKASGVSRTGIPRREKAADRFFDRHPRISAALGMLTCGLMTTLSIAVFIEPTSPDGADWPIAIASGLIFTTVMTGIFSYALFRVRPLRGKRAKAIVARRRKLNKISRLTGVTLGVAYMVGVFSLLIAGSYPTPVLAGLVALAVPLNIGLTLGCLYLMSKPPYSTVPRWLRPIAARLLRKF